MYYEIFGHRVQSEIPLKTLQKPETQSQADFEIRRSRADLFAHPIDWYHEFQALDETAFERFGRRENSDFYIEFEEHLMFKISADGRMIDVDCRDEDLFYASALMLSHILPLALHLVGLEALHGCCVEWNQKAWVFLGVGGAGKSTLAHAFSVNGHRVLSDDVIAIKHENNQAWALPSYPFVQMFPEEDSSKASDKEIIELGDRFAHEPAPLAGIFFLTPNRSTESSLSVSPLTGHARIIGLLKNSFRLNLHDQDRMQQEFTSLARIASAVPCVSLEIPNDKQLLPQVVESLLEEFKLLEKLDEFATA